METNKIIEKIKKLIAHQKSAQDLGSIEEAEAFASKVQKMLTQYNISMKDISFEELKDNITKEIISSRIVSVSDTMGFNLMYVIAKWNFCRVYKFEGDKQKRFIIIGDSNNIEICKSMYDIVLDIFLREGKRIYKLHERPMGLDTYLREFIVGCYNGLDSKFKEERKTFEISHSETTAIVVRNDKAVSEFVKNTFGPVRKSRSSTSYRKGEAYANGFNTGKNVEINKKVN